jgi:primase-polymerase (primpol)-like protein
LPKALQRITKQKRWVIWRWVLDAKKKWTKPPFQCAYPKVKAKSDDASTWGTYEAAIAAVAAGRAIVTSPSVDCRKALARTWDRLMTTSTY